ncbi:hypothetical protein FRX31_028434 [Thalictrum thalictroides]|uniref:Uncharacterized protein n=1 Tax=Thalictrum thalictroides TaxID=46969 RepID=A0A7J6VAZ9_THATH|nr:hypothetical protein FRX31_028434 [Thalictrum thalictroides]
MRLCLLHILDYKDLDDLGCNGVLRMLEQFNLDDHIQLDVPMFDGKIRPVSISLMGARYLWKDAYGANHPAGRIGKSLIFKYDFKQGNLCTAAESVCRSVSGRAFYGCREEEICSKKIPTFGVIPPMFAAF